MTKKLLAGACALALAFASTPVTAQQAVPAAQNAAGQIVQVAPFSPIVAPAGGGVGVGRPVAEDNPFPTSAGVSFQVSPTITVQNAAYSAGNSLGGLITLSNVVRQNGGSGTLQNVRINSAGGLTNTIWVYAWSKSPSATCTDKSAFATNTADKPYALPGFPVSVTLSSPGSWDTSTYGQLTGLSAQFVNQDSSPGKAVYICLVIGSGGTPAATTDISLVGSGIKD